MKLGRLTVGKKKTVVQNPAWDYIKDLPNDDLLSNIYHSTRQIGMTEFRKNMDGSQDVIFHRSRVTGRWTWAIPSPDAIQFIVDQLDGRGVVEMGAGSGYWAWMLSQHGVDVNAYDTMPIGHEKSWYTQEHLDKGSWSGTKLKEFYPVTESDIEALDLPENADRVLFLCWPNYGTSFAYDAVKAFKGDTVIFIGEGSGGCTADDQFWGLMEGDRGWREEEEHLYPEQEWKEVDRHSLPQWGGLHDSITVYRRLA